jgi:ribosomal protein S12 methylthiotransferase accessory factor
MDPRFGIVRGVFEAPREPGAPRFFHYYAEACNKRYGGGASTERDAAMGKAIGEAVERYCSGVYQRDALPLSSVNEAQFTCCDPEEFALYRDDQYAAQRIEFVPFTRDLPVRWTPAIDVENSSEVFVPAGCVYVPWMYDRSEDPPIAQPISTGQACGPGYDAALLSGVCEAIERDSFTIFWQARLAPPRIRVGSLDAANADLLDRFAQARYNVTLFDITTDIAVPAVLAVAEHDDPKLPALCVASAAHPIARVAVRKCLDELEHTRVWCRRAKDVLAPPTHADEILEQEHHLRFWCEHSNRHHADWLFASRIEVDLASLPVALEEDSPALLATVHQSLRALGLRLFAVDLTTPEVRALGLNVVKAVVPGLNPLVIGHIKRALGGRRLREVPLRLGYDAPELPLDDPTNPHPFP